MKKILFVTNDFPPQSGGIETFIEGLIKSLPFGSVVVHASRYSNDQAAEAFDEKLLEEYGVVVVRDRQRILLPTPRLISRIEGTIHAHQPSAVVFGASVPLGLMAGRLRKAGVSRIVAITHGHEVWWAKVPLFSSLLRKVAKEVDYLTYLGQFTANAISRAIRPIDRGKLRHLPPGVDVELFHPGPKSEELLSRYSLHGKMIILCVGRLVQRKGQDQLISAMPEIARLHPSAHLLLVGSGHYEKKLKALARRKGVEERVSFLGRVPYRELPEHFRLADLFASPTRDRFAGLEVEGLGIVYLEASSSGIPVIAGNSGGSPDAVRAEGSGLVVDSRDERKIIEVIDYLLRDEKKRLAMGVQGRQWMEAEWSWLAIGARFRSLLEMNEPQR